MSRIAKAPVELPQGVEFKQDGNVVTIKGSNGSLSLELNSEVEISQEENTLTLVPRSGSRFATAIAGTMRSLLANMVEGGATPLSDAAALEMMGYRIAIFPGGIVRALARTAQTFYTSLQTHGTTRPFLGKMFDFDALNAQLGTEELLITEVHHSARQAVGTHGGGLNRFDPAAGTFEAIRHDPDDEQSLSSDSVWFVIEDPRGDLWIATQGGGINRWLAADRESGRTGR